MLSGKRCPSSLDRHGYCWWMWTLHPSMPKAQAHTNVIFFILFFLSQIHISLASTHTKYLRNISNRSCQATGGESEFGKVSWALHYLNLCYKKREMLCAFVIGVDLMFSFCTFKFWWLRYGLPHAVSPAVPLKQWYYEWVQS